MSDLSKIVMPMSYSVKNALETGGSINNFTDKTGWISSPDSSEKTIVIQINFDAPHSFNRMSFELLDVPQKFAVFYRDAKRNKFVKINSYTGYVEGTVSGSRAGIEQQNLWNYFQFGFPFINTDVIEIRINRVNNSYLLNLPKNTRYSVGVRNTQIRFHRVNDEVLVLNEDDQDRVKYFAPNSVLSDDDTFWKSPPLGPNSLYPFYIDLRTQSGKAQVLEFMKLVPLYTGSHVNIYYSNDDSFGPFGLSNNKKTLNLIGNTISINNDWVGGKGILVQSPTYWQLSNQDIKLNLRSPFTIGFTYEPVDLESTAKHYFWSLDAESENLSCYFLPQVNDPEYVQGDLIVEYNQNEQIKLSDLQLNKDVSYGIIAGYNPKTTEWSLHVAAMDSLESEGIIGNYQAFNGFYPETFSFSMNPDDTVDSTLGFARNIWIKQDVYQYNYASSFIRNTDNFIKGLGDVTRHDSGYYNAVLVAPLTEDLDAKVGPNSFYYNNKTWTPANRSFVLNSSMYNLGRIKAKYLKLEFAKPTVQYYNPATSEDVALPVLDFPDWVKEWYVMHQFDPTMWSETGSSLMFEGRRQITNQSSTYGLNTFKSAIESSQNNIIFNHDQIGYDFFLSDSMDDESIRNQILRNTLTLQFPTTSRHNYKSYDYVMTTKRAFFYGIVELSFFKQDQSLLKDNRVYYGDFLEEDISSVDWINSSTGFFISEEVARSAARNNNIVSETFESFSKFSNLQIAFLESPLKDLLTPEQSNFVTISHLTPSATADVSVVNNLKGTTDGKTILLQRNDSGSYGVTTSEINLLTILQASSASALPLAKFVAGCRVRSGVLNPFANYELRLLSYLNNEWKVAAKKELNLPPDYEWVEIDLVYNRSAADAKFKLEIVCLDSFSNEPMYIDMLSLWMERNRWEVSNNGGSTWVPVIYNVNNAFGMINFPTPGNKLKLRITANEPSSWISEWLIVPIYDYVPVGMSTPRLFDIANSDDPEFQNIMDQKLFLPYSTQIPRNYSTMRDVVTSSLFGFSQSGTLELASSEMMTLSSTGRASLRPGKRAGQTQTKTRGRRTK